MTSALTFAMALWAREDASHGDQPARVELLHLATPFERWTDPSLPPGFFRVVRTIANATDSQRAGLLR